MPLQSRAGSESLLGLASKHYGVVLPAIVIAGLAAMVLPVPAALLDMFFAANITLSIVILVSTMLVKSPMELSVFPTILLLTTLFRLVLNIASTRLILTRSAFDGASAAGEMIRQFGEVVTGNQLVVGLVLFALLFVIQFVVITKGASRISEVSARFALDSLPGRQMSIDSDLNAGLIDETMARWQREELVRQSDFYGAMDGAAKFVRGDAIAGIIITMVNMVGGLLLGTMSYGMDLSRSAEVFTKLTIGDGLVSQIPAVVISLAAGLLVSRSSLPTRLGEQLVYQVARNPIVLSIGGCFALALAAGQFAPVPLIALAMICFFGAFVAGKKTQLETQPEPEVAEEVETRRIEDFLAVDPLTLEIGYGILSFVDRSRGGMLIESLQQLRQQAACQHGIIMPKTRIKDNLAIGPRDYVIKIRGTVVGQGSVPADRWLAVASHHDEQNPVGVPADTTWLSSPSYWIKRDQKAHAERLGYEIVDGVGAITWHLRTIVDRSGADLLSRDQVKRLLDSLKETAPALVDDVIPSILTAGEVHRVLQQVLRSGRSIRDLEIVLETLADHADETRDVGQLAEAVSTRLDRLSHSEQPFVTSNAA